jgi:hypothetical protein
MVCIKYTTSHSYFSSEYGQPTWNTLYCVNFSFNQPAYLCTEVCRRLVEAKAEVYTIIIVLAIVLVHTDSTMATNVSFGSLNQPANLCKPTVNYRLLVMDTSMHTQKPCSGGTIELNHRLPIHWTLSHGFCVSWLTSNLRWAGCLGRGVVYNSGNVYSSVSAVKIVS